MSLNSDQISALTSLADALKGSTLADFVKSAAGQAIASASTPLPVATDTPPAPADKPQEQVLLDLDKTQARAAPSVAVYLAPHTKNYIQRDVNTTKSSYTPCMLLFFYILNCMDTVLSDNYYARRSLPHFYPSVSRIYYAVLIWYQILRVARHVRSIDPEHAAFLDELENEFPPETLSIAAPLLPFFMAITTSTPENKRLRRVFATFPADSLNDETLETRMQDTTQHADWYLPLIPALCHLHHRLMDAFPGTIALGADDSHSPGNKTVNYVPLPGYETVVDLQHHPRSQYRRSYFPLEAHRAHDNAPNATVNPLDLSRITFFGANENGPYGNLPQDARRCMTKCGIAEPYNVHRDLTSQFKMNFARIPIPEVAADYVTETMAAMFVMEEGMSWFSEIAATMSAYATFFPGSGTLGDCSLEGPRTGQYVNQIQAPAAFAEPTYYGMSQTIHNFNAKLTTTVNEEEEITELLARYTQINTRMFVTHPWLGSLGSNIARNGPFWTVRPIYDHSTIDGSWIQTPQVIKSVALERPDKRV